MQSKLAEELTKCAHEMNLKVRALSSPLIFLDPMQVGASFLLDTLDLLDIGLEWVGFGSKSTLFLHFRSSKDQL